MQPVTAEAQPAPKAAEQSKAQVVKITDKGLSPKGLTIKVGETVEWKNESKSTPSITTDSTLAKKKGAVSLPKGASAFSSGDIAAKASFTYTFTTPGTYKYVSMTKSGSSSGTVTVKEASSKKATPKSTKSKKKATTTSE